MDGWTDGQMEGCLHGQMGMVSLVYQLPSSSKAGAPTSFSLKSRLTLAFQDGTQMPSRDFYTQLLSCA